MMLTNIFYYNYYKPYMVSELEASSFTPSTKGKIADKKSSGMMKNQFFILNKTLKTDIIQYAQDISNSVVSLKDSSKNLVQDMEDYNRNISKHGSDTAKSWIAEDLQDFADTFNHASEFMRGQKHSAALRELAQDSTGRMAAHEERLTKLGISFDSDGKMKFDPEVFGRLTQDGVNNAIGEGIQIFQDMYDDAADMMRIPMSEHMNFRGLNYHYSYKMGTIISDTFKAIEAGLIIDKVV